jgi:thioredoxin 1
MKTHPPTPALSHGKVEHIGTDTFQQHVLDADVPVLVDFYADWCGPCRTLSPVLDQVARETPTAKVVKVNIDHSPQLAAQYGVSSIPTLLVFKNGSAVAQHTGLADRRTVQRLLAR